MKTYRLILTLLFSLFASTTWAAITFDAASSGEGTTSATYNATIAADANIVIVCISSKETGGAAAAATGVTVGGSAATLVAGVTNSGNVVRTDMFYKLAPSTGTVEIIATSAAVADFTVSGTMSFKGVAQSSTFGTPVTANSTVSQNMDTDAIGSAVGEMGVYCGGARDNDATASADATVPTSTERYEDPHTTGTSITSFGYTEDGAATSIDMRVDLSLLKQWAAVGVSMRPLAGRAVAPIFFD